MKRKLFLLVILALIVASSRISPAYPFKLTKDLKAEIDEKQWLVKVHPKDPQAHFDLAITYSYSNKIEQGLDELKVVDKLDENYAPKALKYYSMRVTLHPGDWKTRFRYAFALYFNRKKKEAVEEFKKIIKQDKNNIFSYGYIATIYGELNEVDEAIDYAKKAIEIDHDVAALHLLLGAAYYKNNQPGPGFQETFEALRLRALGN